MEHVWSTRRGGGEACRAPASERPRRGRPGHEDHHGPPSAHRSSRIDSRVLGMFLFIASEARCSAPSSRPTSSCAWSTRSHGHRAREVAALAPVQGAARRRRREPYYEFPVFVAGVNTAILVTSSFTMHWAMQSIRRNHRRGLQAGLVPTILLGLAFLLTQMSSTHTSGSTPATAHSPRRSSASTGLHGAHVGVGLSLLTIFAGARLPRPYSARPLPRCRDPGIYWHFVDVMWIVVYTPVYLI